jgi:hypothetical protein
MTHENEVVIAANTLIAQKPHATPKSLNSEGNQQETPRLRG